jgi:hypothetical protein
MDSLESKMNEPINLEIEVKDWINLHKEHAQEIIKVSEEEYGKGYFDGVKKAVTLIYKSLFNEKDMHTYDYEAYGVVHVFENDFIEFIKNELGVELK